MFTLVDIKLSVKKILVQYFLNSFMSNLRFFEQQEIMEVCTRISELHTCRIFLPPSSGAPLSLFSGHCVLSSPITVPAN